MGHIKSVQMKNTLVCDHSLLWSAPIQLQYGIEAKYARVIKNNHKVK